MCEQTQKAKEFQRDLGTLLKVMRTKRKKSQSDFSTPQRTIRRIEKGETPCSTTMHYLCELEPCPGEAAHWIRMLAEMLEPECKRCNPDCQLCGKSYLEFANAVRVLVGVPKRD